METVETCQRKLHFWGDSFGFFINYMNIFLCFASCQISLLVITNKDLNVEINLVLRVYRMCFLSVILYQDFWAWTYNHCCWRQVMMAQKGKRFCSWAAFTAHYFQKTWIEYTWCRQSTLSYTLSPPLPSQIMIYICWHFSSLLIYHKWQFIANKIWTLR